MPSAGFLRHDDAARDAVGGTSAIAGLTAAELT